MRIEVSGAQITDRVVDVLEALQEHDGCSEMYISAIDSMTRVMILDDTTCSDDTETMHSLRALQMLRRDILTLLSPPDVDLPGNDIPAITL